MELTGKTQVTISELKELINFVDLRKVQKQVQDIHGVPAKEGDVRRWQDGKLHIKTSAGWELLENTSGYDKKVDEQSKHNNKGKSIPVTSKEDYRKFVDFIFTTDDVLRKKRNEDLPKIIRFPDLSKTLSYQLGTKPSAVYVFKNRYGHVIQKRKEDHNHQDLRKSEFFEIPIAIKNAKSAVIDLKKKNFFISFPDRANLKKVNKIVFEKSTAGNYLVTVCKIDKSSLIQNENMYKIEC